MMRNQKERSRGTKVIESITLVTMLIVGIVGSTSAQSAPRQLPWKATSPPILDAGETRDEKLAFRSIKHSYFPENLTRVFPYGKPTRVEFSAQKGHLTFLSGTRVLAVWATGYDRVVCVDRDPTVSTSTKDALSVIATVHQDRSPPTSAVLRVSFCTEDGRPQARQEVLISRTNTCWGDASIVGAFLIVKDLYQRRLRRFVAFSGESSFLAEERAFGDLRAAPHDPNDRRDMAQRLKDDLGLDPLHPLSAHFEYPPRSSGPGGPGGSGGGLGGPSLPQTYSAHGWPPAYHHPSPREASSFRKAPAGEVMISKCPWRELRPVIMSCGPCGPGHLRPRPAVTKTAIVHTARDGRRLARFSLPLSGLHLTREPIPGSRFLQIASASAFPEVRVKQFDLDRGPVELGVIQNVTEGFQTIPLSSAIRARRPLWIEFSSHPERPYGLSSRPIAPSVQFTAIIWETSKPWIAGRGLTLKHEGIPPNARITWTSEGEEIALRIVDGDSEGHSMSLKVSAPENFPITSPPSTWRMTRCIPGRIEVRDPADGRLIARPFPLHRWLCAD